MEAKMPVKPNWVLQLLWISIFASGHFYLSRCSVFLCPSWGKSQSHTCKWNRNFSNKSSLCLLSQFDPTISIQSIIQSLPQLVFHQVSVFSFTQPASQFLPCLPLWLCFIDTTGINLYLLRQVDSRANIHIPAVPAFGSPQLSEHLGPLRQNTRAVHRDQVYKRM